MESQRGQNSQLDEFIVKVKLLTNEVYEFPIKENVTKVQELKKMIHQKLNIPVERQRIVFGGKALVDSNNVTQYVKQSGMTVHLIAKMNPTNQPTNIQTNQQPNTNANSTNSNNTSSNIPNFSSPPPQNSNNPQQANPFGSIFQMVLGGPQQTTMSFNNMNDLNSSLSGLLGGLGIQMPMRTNQTSTNQNQNRTPTNANQTSEQNRNQPPVNSFQTPVNQARRQANQQNVQSSTINQTQLNQSTSNVSNQPLLNLNAAISRLNLPPEAVHSNSHLNLREQTAQYLRRLQHQMMRMIPQLNRGIQLLNQGRVTHMTGFLPLFQGLNVANQQAIRAIRRINNLPQGQNMQIQQSSRNQNQNRDLNNENQINMQATIIIANGNDNENHQNSMEQENETDFVDYPQSQNGQIRVESNSFNVPPGFNLGSLNLGGLFSNLMGGAQNQAHNSTQNQNQPNSTTSSVGSSQNPQNSSNQVPPPFNIGSLLSGMTGQNTNQSNNQGAHNQINFGNSASMMFNPNLSANNQNNRAQSNSNVPQSNNSTTSQQQPSNNNNNQRPGVNVQQPSNNPFGGINIMDMFSQLNQTGGVGQVMSMSIGDMLDEQAQQPSVYGQLFKGVTGQDLMSCLTTKNVQFLDRKYQQFRQNLLKSISIAGSRQDLITKISVDLQKLLVPRQQTKNIQQCSEKVRKIIRKRIQEIVSVTLNKQNDKYSDRFITILKGLLCESIDQTLPYVDQNSEEIVFNNIKKNIISKLDEFIQGLSGMLYSFIQKDLIRVYTEHKTELERKKKRSEQEKLKQQNLIQSIVNESKKDIAYLKNMKYSQYYYPK